MLFLIFTCISMHAQLYSEYELCISEESSSCSLSMRDGVYIELKLSMDNQYEMVLLDQRSSDIVELSYLSLGTYYLVYDTLKLKEHNDTYIMKFIIGENGDLIPYSSFSGFKGKVFKGSACAFFEAEYTNYLCKRCLSKRIPIRCRFSKMPEKGHYCDGDLELSFKEGYYCLKYCEFVLSEGVCSKNRNRLFLYDSFLDAELDVLYCEAKLYLKFCYYQFVMNSINGY